MCPVCQPVSVYLSSLQFSSHCWLGPRQNCKTGGQTRLNSKLYQATYLEKAISNFKLSVSNRKPFNLIHLYYNSVIVIIRYHLIRPYFVITKRNKSHIIVAQIVIFFHLDCKKKRHQRDQSLKNMDRQQPRVLGRCMHPLLVQMSFT